MFQIEELRRAWKRGGRNSSDPGRGMSCPLPTAAAMSKFMLSAFVATVSVVIPRIYILYFETSIICWEALKCSQFFVVSVALNHDFSP
jgi:hypothetical protein